MPGINYVCLAYVEQGGQLVIGPGVPYLDPALLPCDVLSKHVHKTGRTAIGAGSIWWVSQADIPAMIEMLVETEAYWCEDANVKLVLQTCNEHSLLFVANPTDRAHEVVLHFQGERSLSRVWGEACVCTGVSAIGMELEPYSVQIWEVLQ